jgi:hypothetical protein
MALAHGSGIVTDGLVFAYDNGSSQSWKGAPTTNIVTNTNLDTGWSKGYNTSIQYDDYPPPAGIDSQVVSFIDSNGNGSGYWYSYGDYAPQGDGVTYYTSVWARTVGSSWNVRGYTANNTESGRVWMNIKTVPGDGKWHRLEFNAITTANPNDSDSLSFQFTYIPPNQRCWLCAPQMTTGGHYPFVAGTRSTTQALTDWAGGNTITLNGMQYNSDGTFQTSGATTTDYISIANSALSSQASSGTWTIDFWLKMNARNSSLDHILQTGSGNDFLWYLVGSTLYFANTATTSLTLPTLSTNTWFNLTMTGSSGSIQVYKDGSYVGSMTNTTTFSINSTIGIIMGQEMDTNSGGFAVNQSFQGYYGATKFYDRVLSAAEVAKNYNALRGRFGV